jgi:hypothetical protein
MKFFTIFFINLAALKLNQIYTTDVDLVNEIKRSFVKDKHMLFTLKKVKANIKTFKKVKPKQTCAGNITTIGV